VSLITEREALAAVREAEVNHAAASALACILADAPSDVRESARQVVCDTAESLRLARAVYAVALEQRAAMGSMAS